MPIFDFTGGFVPHDTHFNRYLIQSSHVVKPSDESRTNVTTPTADTHLVVQVAAATDYWVQGLFIYTGDTTGDMPIKWSIPSGATITYCTDALGSAATATTDIVSRSMQTLAGGPSFGCVTGSDAIAVPKGLLRVGANSGSVRILWGTGAALSATMRARSLLQVRRLTT